MCRSLADLKIVKMCAATSSDSVLGHTYVLMTTSVPLIQQGGGSRGSTGNSNSTTAWSGGETRRLGLRKADDHEVEQREEGARVDKKCV